MERSLKTGFAQIFSCCPKNLSCPKFGGAAAPLAPPARTPMDPVFWIPKIWALGFHKQNFPIFCILDYPMWGENSGLNYFQELMNIPHPNEYLIQPEPM